MRRKGFCKRCGRCCKTRLLMKGMPLKMKLIMFLFAPRLIWRYVTGGGCQFLTFDKDGKARCKIYDRRPWFCREFPSEPKDLIDKDCGYYFKEEEGKREII